MDKEDRYIDEIYHFEGKWEVPSLCGLKIVEKADHHQVIFTELYMENPGSSVTEMILSLAEQVVRKYHLDPERTEFIVRNPERSAHYEFYAETFHLAVMKWDGEGFSGLIWRKLN